jgi:hypothetical protein
MASWRKWLLTPDAWHQFCTLLQVEYLLPGLTEVFGGSIVDIKLTSFQITKVVGWDMELIYEASVRVWVPFRPARP